MKTTCVGILNDSILFNDLQSDVDFGHNLHLVPIPQWIKQDGAVRELNKWQREKIQRHTSHVFLRQPDTNDLPAATDTKEIFKIALISCWLAKPTALCVEEYLTYEETADGTFLKEYVDGELLAPLYKYQSSRFRMPDVQSAIQIFDVLRAMPRENSLSQSVWALWAALRDHTWEIRFLFLWISLESLFGPESPAELTYRMSQRIAFFVKGGRSRTKHLNDFVVKSYGWRSKVAHGIRLGKTGNHESKKYLYITEAILRAALLRIVQDKRLLAVFSGRGKFREEYLNELPYNA